ncbi:hypothetical protein HMF7854_13410 [Sphingomonas ginkgonis]|uniref:DUF4231 domain-containing protein n=1 Tax=Sphingomonas ginkgonis TaxID=2315330 RepID=A0A429VCW2_9SPHN|nr:hypothetical protein [Sphingomonas ginkgonis]RST31726.1 hypothetical protein HMF7854_13410 [Sphingomonas ginkgonis]
MTASAGHPPKPPFTLAVGVTGHRSGRFAPGAAEQLAGEVGRLLDRLVERGREIARVDAAHFAPAEPRFLLLSALADGADQIVAEAGLERGFELQAILPMPADTYEQTLDGERWTSAFRRLLEQAGRTLEIESSHVEEGYWLAGRALVAHSDLLIALWDGERGRGKGGTADVVQWAIARGTPVLHLPLDPALPPRLIWSPLDPATMSQDPEAMCSPLDDEDLAAMLGAVAAPPPDPQERAFLDRFWTERRIRWHWRIDYPLLRALTGTRRLSPADISADRQRRFNAREWSDYRAASQVGTGIHVGLGSLETIYDWVDTLASHFAQAYRSGHIFNFAFAALSILVGISGLTLPGGKLAMAGLEIGIVILILSNTSAGIRWRWHQRWLDYRQLAERLRPMRSLKLLGVASPDPPGDPAEPVAGRWIEWYAAAVWRSLGVPHGRLDTAASARLATIIAGHELEPQIAYHRKLAAQSRRFDERLELVSTLLFLGTVIACLTVLLGTIFLPGFVRSHSWYWGFISTGFPAIGAAIFGIRVQGDYGGTAIRSLGTARQLRRIADALGEEPHLGRAADLVEQAARVMLADLDSWKLIHEQHELSAG